MSLEDILVEEENKYFKATTFIAKLNHINTIIQIKKHLPGQVDTDSIYRDVKQYIYYSLMAPDESLFEYDRIDQSKIIATVSMLDYSKQAKMYKYLERLLRHNNFDSELKWAGAEARKAEFLSLYQFGWKINGIRNNICKLLFAITSLNIYTITFTLLVIVLITFVVLLPSQCDSHAIFSVHYHRYNSNFYLNHLMNVISIFLSMKNDLKITPTCAAGFFVILGSKGFTFLVVGNYLIKELEKRFKQ